MFLSASESLLRSYQCTFKLYGLHIGDEIIAFVQTVNNKGKVEINLMAETL